MASYSRMLVDEIVDLKAALAAGEITRWTEAEVKFELVSLRGSLVEEMRSRIENQRHIGLSLSEALSAI